MDAVYPLGDGSLWENNEIKYSVALLRQNAPWIKNIYVVGKSSPVGELIEFTENQAPAVNIWLKGLEACLDKRVSDPFLFINDDHFIIKPIPKEYPAYYTYPIKDYPYKKYSFGGQEVEHPYQRLVKRTHDILGDVLFYQPHCPFIVYKDLYLATMKRYEDYIFSDCGLLVKTTYFKGAMGVQMDDYKTKERDTLEMIEYNTRDRHIFSTCADISEGAKQYLQKVIKL